ncbi:MAG TPA: chromate efflux transporter [Tepidisphaeraceae bacterium]|nr:chromate efflux transporter [Tepidisphaeraceae bacterium]
MDDSRPRRLRELARLFGWLGLTAFGGPAAHVALIERQVVERRGWLDRQHFLDLIAAINFIPGPNSTQLVICLGQMRAGFAGLIVAGVSFIAPAMLLILPLAWMYVRAGELPQVQSPLRAISAAVAAIVAVATLRFARTALRSTLAAVVAILAIIIAPLLQQRTAVKPEIPILFVSAIVGIVHQRTRSWNNKVLSIGLPLGFWPQIVQMFWELIKIGATLFGSGYVLVSYLQSSMIYQHGWLTPRQLDVAIAVGQFTPGPLLTTATFVGYLLGAGMFGGGTMGGVIGGIVATIAIFLPSFILVAIFGPVIQRIRNNSSARGALDAMNAAVVALMAVATVRLMTSAICSNDTRQISITGIFIFILTMIGLWKRINATWLILLAGAIGAFIS